MKTKKYSVLLVYPDYLASNFGQETYLAYVEAESPFQAVALAQNEAANAATDAVDLTTDFFPALVCEGHIEDLSAEVG